MYEATSSLEPHRDRDPEFNAKAQRRKGAKAEETQKKILFFFVSLRLCAFAPLR
jgi:hypothetical protein